MTGDSRENVIEWCNGDDTISVTLNQVKFITRVRKLAEKYPDKVQILAENKDGSIFAHLPLKSLKLTYIEKESCTPPWLREDDSDDV